MASAIIRGGLIVDGTGRPGHVADLAVADGRIVGIGDGVARELATRRVVDASGLVVAPGVIDVHTHYDAQLLWDPLLGASTQYGVTTVVVGNCGVGVAPVNPGDSSYLVQLLAHVEGMPTSALESGLTWNWRTFPEYLGLLDTGLGPNVIPLVGHSPLRYSVMGAAAHQRTATSSETSAMAEQLAAALTAGAWGFSSSAAGTHNDLAGRPAPSRLAALDELGALADVVGHFPFGVIGISPESKLRGLTSDDRRMLSMLSVRGGASVNWNPMVHTSSIPDLWRTNLSASLEAAEVGGRVYAVWNPSSTGGTRVDLQTCFLFMALPRWRQYATLSTVEKTAAFGDPAIRAELAGDLEHDQSMGALTARLRSMWDILRVTEVFDAQNAVHLGRTVGDIARESGRTPLDTMLDIAVADNLRTVFMQDDVKDEPPAAREAYEALVASPHVVFGGSDAGAHLDMLANESLSARTLAWRVREQGSLTLEEAVRRFTSGVADAIGLRGRGRLAAGMAADIVLFDPETIGAGDAHLVHDLPGGAERLATEAQGVAAVLVNGEVVFEDGKPTGALPGGVLRSGEHAS